MGVDYSPILYLGREFENEIEAAEFVKKHLELIEEDLKIIEQEGLQEWIDKSVLYGEITNYYVSKYDSTFVLGFDLSGSVDDPRDFCNRIDAYEETWEELFPNEPYSIVHTVKIH